MYVYIWLGAISSVHNAKENMRKLNFLKKIFRIEIRGRFSSLTSGSKLDLFKKAGFPGIGRGGWG